MDQLHCGPTRCLCRIFELTLNHLEGTKSCSWEPSKLLAPKKMLDLQCASLVSIKGHAMLTKCPLAGWLFPTSFLNRAVLSFYEAQRSLVSRNNSHGQVHMQHGNCEKLLCLILAYFLTDLQKLQKSIWERHKAAWWPNFQKITQPPLRLIWICRLSKERNKYVGKMTVCDVQEWSEMKFGKKKTFSMNDDCRCISIQMLSSGFLLTRCSTKWKSRTNKGAWLNLWLVSANNIVIKSLLAGDALSSKLWTISCFFGSTNEANCWGIPRFQSKLWR